jgi:hypothetical protein
MDETLTPIERTCKLIGEKYGPAARALLKKIKERKERARLQAHDESRDPILDRSIKRI